jgi:ParB family chromosome partitioning protein
MIKSKGLGRGLDALLGGGKTPPVDQGVLRDIAIGDLSPGKYQPRTRMDKEALEGLAQSIQTRGVVQPILVRELTAGKFEIVAGERRWRAAQIAGLITVPALVREIADEHALGIGLIENIQREDLNAIEEAAGIKRLIDEFQLTHESAAQAVGRSRAAVTNLLRLLSLGAM